MNFSEAPEFKKEIKSLAKKWRSIPSDIKAAEQYILPLYIKLDKGVDIEQYRTTFFNGKTATILHSENSIEVVKMRLDVECLGRNDKVRIVFVAIKNKDEIMFVELYAKNEKSREDERRIKKYLQIAKENQSCQQTKKMAI